MSQRSIQNQQRKNDKPCGNIFTCYPQNFYGRSDKIDKYNNCNDGGTLLALLVSLDPVTREMTLLAICYVNVPHKAILPADKVRLQGIIERVCFITSIKRTWRQRPTSFDRLYCSMHEVNVQWNRFVNDQQQLFRQDNPHLNCGVIAGTQQATEMLKNFILPFRILLPTGRYNPTYTAALYGPRPVIDDGYGSVRITPGVRAMDVCPWNHLALGARGNVNAAQMIPRDDVPTGNVGAAGNVGANARGDEHRSSSNRFFEIALRNVLTDCATPVDVGSSRRSVENRQMNIDDFLVTPHDGMPTGDVGAMDVQASIIPFESGYATVDYSIATPLGNFSTGDSLER
eukprot:m.322306 g.322306  ORF g.322306 m.322306 type:complete len:343 (+) comp20348_c0_seq2:533-1561(+)